MHQRVRLLGAGLIWVSRPLYAVRHDVVVVQVRQVGVVEGVRAPVGWTPVAEDRTLHLPFCMIEVTGVALYRCDLRCHKLAKLLDFVWVPG